MSAPIELGETYQYQWTPKDTAGNTVAAGSVTATITLPDGTTKVSPTDFTVTGLGPATIDYLTTQAGRHVLLGTATGGALGTATEKFEDVFHVEPAGRYLVGIDEAVTHLRGTNLISTVADLEQLRWLILAASDAMERDLGRQIARRTVTRTYDGGKCALLLLDTPVISITTVTENSVAVAAAGYTLDTTAGILYRGATTAPIDWIWGRQNITVTSVVGMAEVPAVLRKIAVNAIARMWQHSQQMPHPALDPDTAVALAVGTLTPLELGAYNSFRPTGFA